MKRFLLFCLVLSGLFWLPTRAYCFVAVVESIRIPPYEAAVKGFSEACINCTTAEQFVLSDMDRGEILPRIADQDPRLILAVGNAALESVAAITRIPIVYVMVLNPWDIVRNQENITGVSMNIPHNRQMEILIAAAPRVERIGFLYDPDRNGLYAEKARAAAREVGVGFVSAAVRNSAEMPEKLDGIIDDIDGFWMIPDITVYTAETIPHLLLHCLERRIPVLTFSEKYLNNGAFISVTFDPEDMGRQAGEMALKIIEENAGRRVLNTEARKPVIRINRAVGRQLGIESDLDAAKMTFLERGE